MRQIVLDTETTGLEPNMGHRIIEIGGVEIVNRKLTGRHFHKYINPERDISEGAFEVHGISREFLADKPVFAQVWEELIEFITDTELVIHNAPFDVGFLDYELGLLRNVKLRVDQVCQVTDSLALARHKHPGQKNNLDALCRRYSVDNSSRQLHGALLDAEILADVYLLMTGGQTNLFGASEDSSAQAGNAAGEEAAMDLSNWSIPVIHAKPDEVSAHDTFVEEQIESAGTPALWKALSA